VLNGLPNGIYQWSLRSVDAAYVGSQIAVGEFSIGVVSADEPNNDIPNSYAIEQNFPNPFNPTTTIRYSIPENGLVILKIYNAIGKEMDVLQNEIKQAGNYEIKYDGSKLPSGVYFYQLKSGSFVETKKMILLK